MKFKKGDKVVLLFNLDTVQSQRCRKGTTVEIGELIGNDMYITYVKTGRVVYAFEHQLELKSLCKSKLYKVMK